MRTKLSKESKKGIKFISQLLSNEMNSYPIDYESYDAPDKEITETMELWTGNKKWNADGDSLVQFGMDGSGSMFCLWYYPNLKGEPPVVFLGSEGHSCLVSNNLNDFIKHTCSGKLFSDGEWLDPYLDDEKEFDWLSLKNKAEKLIGKWSTSPEELRDTGKLNHPDFNAWAESKIE